MTSRFSHDFGPVCILDGFFYIFDVSSSIFKVPCIVNIVLYFIFIYSYISNLAKQNKFVN